MGKRGPKPTPTAILEARGSWLVGTRKDEPRPVEGIPECPEWLIALDAYAVEVWHKLVPLLVAQRTLAEPDWIALATLCQAVSEARRYTELAECAEPGTVEWSRLITAINNARAVILRMSQRFGLTPSDRAGMHIEDKPAASEPSKSRFFAPGKAG